MYSIEICAICSLIRFLLSNIKMCFIAEMRLNWFLYLHTVMWAIEVWFCRNHRRGNKKKYQQKNIFMNVINLNWSSNKGNQRSVAWIRKFSHVVYIIWIFVSKLLCYKKNDQTYMKYPVFFFFFLLAPVCRMLNKGLFQNTGHCLYSAYIIIMWYVIATKSADRILIRFTNIREL